MNIVHLKYAVEVAKCGSINKAAEALFVGQPNLSRAIKELEASLGIIIFERSAKGMEITPEGETFLHYARSILKQIDDVEAMYKSNTHSKLRFSISVPRASYISDAFSHFSLGYTPVLRVGADNSHLSTMLSVVQFGSGSFGQWFSHLHLLSYCPVSHICVGRQRNTFPH